MAISYPLAIPDSIGLASIELKSSNAVAISSSPFTFNQTVFAYPGQRWLASVSIPPVRRDTAEPWVAFLVSLRGQYGTFLMGDPNCKVPQGNASGNLLVNGASQTGGTLVCDNMPLSTLCFKAGDYIQLGTSDATRTLHKVLQDATSDGSGNLTLEIWPHIRTAPLNNQVVTYTNTVGRWRLASNETAWSIDSATKYGISFECVEAI